MKLGAEYGRWTYVGEPAMTAGQRTGLFRCRCGVRKRVSLSSVLRSKSRSCGCLRTQQLVARRVRVGVDLRGRRFGRWTVLSKAPPRVYGRQKVVQWRCRCDCGNTRLVSTSGLLDKNSRNCGCLPSIKHGHARRGGLTVEYALLHGAHARAKKYGRPIDIGLSDITIPAVCPVLGIPLTVGRGKLHHGSPSIDRIRSDRGYVKGNIRVISHRANTLKRDATLEELKKVVADLRRLERTAA